LVIKKINKSIWSFYELVVLHFGAKNVIYYATIIYLVARENTTYFGCKNNFFTNKAKKKTSYQRESFELIILWYILYN
jgi:hypothetical protein